MIKSNSLQNFSLEDEGLKYLDEAERKPLLSKNVIQLDNFNSVKITDDAPVGLNSKALQSFAKYTFHFNISIVKSLFYVFFYDSFCNLVEFSGAMIQ